MHPQVKLGHRVLRGYSWWHYGRLPITAASCPHPTVCSDIASFRVLCDYGREFAHIVRGASYYGFRRVFRTSAVGYTQSGARDIVGFRVVVKPALGVTRNVRGSTYKQPYASRVWPEFTAVSIFKSATRHAYYPCICCQMAGFRVSGNWLSVARPLAFRAVRGSHVIPGFSKPSVGRYGFNDASLMLGSIGFRVARSGPRALRWAQYARGLKYADTLKRYAEAIAMDYITPFRIFNLEPTAPVLEDCYLIYADCPSQLSDTLPGQDVFLAWRHGR